VTIFKECTLGDRTCKVHLDGYNPMEMLTGKGANKREDENVW
jgi:hypothetical protein